MMTSLKTFWSGAPKETINVAPSFTMSGTALKLASSLSINSAVNMGLVSEFKMREVCASVNLSISNDFCLHGNNYAYGMDNATSKNYFLSHSKTYLGHARLILIESDNKIELNAPKTNISVSHDVDDPSVLFNVGNSYLNISHDRCVMCAPDDGGNGSITMKVGANSSVELKSSGITLKCGSSIIIKGKTELPDASIDTAGVNMLSDKVKITQANININSNNIAPIIYNIQSANLNPG